MKKLVFILIVCLSLPQVSLSRSKEKQEINEKVSSFYGNISEYKRSGYKGFLDVGYTIGAADYAINRAVFETSHGYQFFPYLFLGAGLGVHLYHEDGETQSLLPVFADLRVNFSNKRKIIPFIGIKTGYSFLLEDDFEKVGIYVSPNVGIKYRFGYRFGINFTAGYTAQFVDMYYDKENIGGVNFKIGFEF